MHPRGSSRGFSLMEVVVTLAILGVMAAMAAPFFLEKIVREQIKSALPLADVAKKPIAAAWTAGAGLPANNAAAGLPAADKIVSTHVSEVRVQNGAIHLVFGNQANKSIAGKVLTLRPAVVVDETVVPPSWVCARAAVPAKMTVQGVDLTDVDERLLPFECKP